MFFVTQLFFSSFYIFLFHSLSFLHFGLVRIVPSYSKIEFLSSYQKRNEHKKISRKMREPVFGLSLFFSFILSHWRILCACSRNFLFLLYFGANAWTRQCVALCRIEHRKIFTHSTEVVGWCENGYGNWMTLPFFV